MRGAQPIRWAVLNASRLVQRLGFLWLEGGVSGLILRSSVVAGGGAAGLYYAGPELGNLTPTIYAATSSQGTGSGNSEANAMALTSALTSATAGAIIGCLPGAYSKSPNNQRWHPAWITTNSGASGNPIIVVAKRSAIDLAGKSGNATWSTSDLSAVFAHADRCELRHTGVSDGNGGGTGGPAFGSLDQNDVWWIGFCADQNENSPIRDTGPCVLWSSTRCRIMRSVIYGRPAPYTTDTGDNHVGIRLEGATSCELWDNVIYGFVDSVGGVGTGHNHCGVERYDSTGTRIYYCHTFGNHTGIFLKDSDVNPSSDEIVRYNLCKDVISGIEVGNVNVSGAADDYVEFNLAIGCEGSGINGQQGSGVNVHVRNNTLYVQGAGPGTGAGFDGNGFGTGCDFRNNIVVTTAGVLMNEQQFRSAILSSNYNCYYATGGGFQARFNSTNFTTFGTWQSGATRDGNSINSNPSFVNTAVENFKLQGASPCLTASDVGGPVGCYITGNETIGPRYA